MDKMPVADKQKVIERYSERYQRLGAVPAALGWDKGKQDLRYHMLFDGFELEGKRILDIGCGFGDANKLIAHRAKSYAYLGVDVVADLVHQAQTQWRDYPDIEFMLADFLDTEFSQRFDIVVASGVFNFKLEQGDNLAFIRAFMEKAWQLADEGVAFDFLSNQVDFQYEHTFHSDPADIVNMAFTMTRNVRLRHDYMPFEFCVTLLKDQSFDKADTIFNRFKHETGYYRFY